jgi:hypothetical protein
LLSQEDTYYLEKSLEVFWKKQMKKKENQKFANDINIILKKYGIQKTINHTHLVRIKLPGRDSLSLSYFQNRKEDVNRLAKIVENHIWNNPEENTYIYHFTKEEFAKSIKSSKKLRLYNLFKRYDDGEIKDFLKDFSIPYEIKENYDNIFYSSFTSKIPNLSDTNIIKEFRNFTGNYGARLKFKVLKKDNNFRYINYDKNKFNLIHDLRKTIKDNHQVDLIVNGFTTRFASFYVNEKYSHENEVRLYKNLFFDKEFFIQKDENDFSYIDFNLNNQTVALEEIIYERDEEIFET